MHISFCPRGVLQVDDARITFKNFEGRGDKYNREGDRNFVLVLDPNDLTAETINGTRLAGDAVIEALQAEGWNITIKPPKEGYDEPFNYLKVKIKFNDRGPKVYVKSGRAVNELTESTVGMLDQMDIAGIDMDIRPYDWEMSDGKSGRTAYLQSIHVIQALDRFAARYSDRDNEAPFA